MNSAAVKPWEEVDHDRVSGRRIFNRETESGNGGYGGHHFEVSADFEVRDTNGRILLKKSGSAKGEYWCGVFLWFVEGSEGRQVRLDESDEEDRTFNVPDPPTSKQDNAQ